jgi:hypothetical protein
VIAVSFSCSELMHGNYKSVGAVVGRDVTRLGKVAEILGAGEGDP